MDELKWTKLIEVYGRMEAEIIESYLEANDIDVELFQEAVGHHIYPTTIDGLARVQIFVATNKIKAAKDLLDNYYQNAQNKENA